MRPSPSFPFIGPTGKVLLLPADTNAPLICVATGTGIAPFRSFWRRCFMENVPSYKFTGLFWLFMGVANSDAKLYDEELQALAKAYPAQFRLDYALSREGAKNKRGGKMYIQVCVTEGSERTLWLGLSMGLVSMVWHGLEASRARTVV
jgi:ferredoxin--NADP+ reductase